MRSIAIQRTALDYPFPLSYHITVCHWLN